MATKTKEQVMFNTILCTILVLLGIGIIGCMVSLCVIAAKQPPTPFGE